MAETEVVWLATATHARSLHAVIPGSNHTLCQPSLRRRLVERDGLPRCTKCAALFRHREVGDGGLKPVTAFAIYARKQLLLRDARIPVYWLKSVAEEEAAALRAAGYRAEVRTVFLFALKDKEPTNG